MWVVLRPHRSSETPERTAAPRKLSGRRPRGKPGRLCIGAATGLTLIAPGPILQGVNRRTYTVLYDADCAFCSAQMRRLKRLDWRRRLELVPMAEAGTLCDRAGIERVALAGAIHGVGENGRVTRAARCLREMALRIPLLVPVGLVLFLPGALRLAEWLYRRVAARRHELSGWACAGGACRGSRPAGG